MQSELPHTSEQGVHSLCYVWMDAPAVAIDDFDSHIKGGRRHALYDRLLAAPPLCLVIAQRHPASWSVPAPERIDTARLGH